MGFVPREGAAEDGLHPSGRGLQEMGFVPRRGLQEMGFVPGEGAAGHGLHPLARSAGGGLHLSGRGLQEMGFVPWGGGCRRWASSPGRGLQEMGFIPLGVGAAGNGLHPSGRGPQEMGFVPGEGAAGDGLLLLGVRLSLVDARAPELVIPAAVSRPSQGFPCRASSLSSGRSRRAARGTVGSARWQGTRGPPSSWLLSGQESRVAPRNAPRRAGFLACPPGWSPRRLHVPRPRPAVGMQPPSSSSPSQSELVWRPAPFTGKRAGFSGVKASFLEEEMVQEFGWRFPSQIPLPVNPRGAGVFPVIRPLSHSLTELLGPAAAGSGVLCLPGKARWKKPSAEITSAIFLGSNCRGIPGKTGRFAWETGTNPSRRCGCVARGAGALG